MRRPLFLAGLAVLAGSFAAAPVHAAGRDLTGQPAPEIYVQQGLNGLPTGVTLQSFRGKPVVLKFFFTNCPACRDTLPEFERLYRQYGSRVQFIAVGYDTRWAIEALWRRSGYSAPIAVDEYGLTAQRYGVVTYPTTYVVGGDGRVVSYDLVTPSILERELARSGAAPALPAAAAPGSSGYAPGAAPAVTAGGVPGAVSPAAAAAAGERNVVELGAVPAALAGVTDAARGNDYGTVLRIAEKHVDAATEPADVVAAAHRIERIAVERSERRKARIQERWRLGDQRGALDMIDVMADDFKGTSVEAGLREWSKRVRADLVARGVLAAR